MNRIPKKLQGISTEDRIEYVLCKLEKADARTRNFWLNYQLYLSTQRELLISDILKELKKVGRKKLKDTFHRVVLSSYMDNPLSTYGSLLQSGRFHLANDDFQQIKGFPCLYVSSTAQGAINEKFPNSDNKKLKSSKMSLIEDKSFLKVRCEINLTKCIDLRNLDSIKGFTKVISKIEPTRKFQKSWQKIQRTNKQSGKIEPLITAKSPRELYRSLFEVYYMQWLAHVDVPSNSQWFGYYVKKAKIEGIIYPSLQSKKSYNLAIYPENFLSKSYVRLIDDMPAVQKDRLQIDKTNHTFFRV